MKIYLIRCLCLLVVLCFTVCFMANFAFASSDIPSLTLQLVAASDNSSEYFLELDSYSFDALLDIYLQKMSFNLSIPSVGVSVNTDPSLYRSEVVEDGLTLYLCCEDPRFGLLSAVDGFKSLYLVLPASAGPFVDVTFSEAVPDPLSPISSLVSDFRLTGQSFLETVEGIVVTIGKNPLLLLTVGIFFAGGCIGIFGRFLSKD